jgi:hypothetical protein
MLRGLCRENFCLLKETLQPQFAQGEMEMTTIDLTGSPEEIAAIVAWAKERGEVDEISEPTNLDASKALNVGLPHIDPTEALNFITLVFTTGTAALTFLKALRGVLKKPESAVAVSSTITNQKLGQIESQTSDQVIEQMVES